MALLNDPQAQDLLQHWLELCGLNFPDSAYPLVLAATEDFRQTPDLQAMLQAPPEDFLRWWHAQDHTPYRMTAETGGTTWAWLVLARAGAEVSDSRFGGLGLS